MIILNTNLSTLCGGDMKVTREFKTLLVKHGYNLDIENPSWGPKCKSAVKDFQSKNGLNITGVIDKHTLALLNKEPISGDSHPRDKLPGYYLIAKGEVGIKEIPGKKDNPKIREYHKSVDGKEMSEENHWCAAFVHWCLKKANEKAPVSQTRRARSFLKYGAEVKNPKEGDIVIFWRTSIDSKDGHVAFFVKETSKGIVVLGGNQSDAVNESVYPKSRLLGYRRPA